MSQAQAKKVEILRKITVKGVAGSVDVEELLKAPDKKMSLMRVFGFAAKAKPGESEYGSYVRFSGQFRAVNLQTGEEFSSGSVILPGTAQDLLAGALDNDAVDSVQFGFEIGVRFDKDAVTKYVFEVTSLIKPAEDDPMERLAKEMGTVPALENKTKDKATKATASE